MKKKTKILSILSAVIMCSAVTFSVAGAQVLESVNIHANANANVGLKIQDKATNTETRTDVRENSTSSVRVNEDASSTISSSSDSQGDVSSETHRSVVSTFVKSLLAVADREGDIGAQVRVVAQSQNDSASTTASAMTKVDERGSLRTFFFGSDYRNLGVIRSEIATTTENIAQLKTLLDQATSTTDREELNAQIQVLEAEQVKVNAYVTAHENTFSLFGWFSKLFVR